MASSSPQSLAKRRGKSFEGKLAKLLPNAHIHPGQDGDVKVYLPNGETVMVEAKFRTGLTFSRSDDGLPAFLDQIERYVTYHWPRGQRWALAITGGRKALHKRLSPSGTFMLIPIEEYIEYLTLRGAQPKTP